MWIDSGNPDVHYHRANILHKLLRWNEAFAAYSRTLELDPEHLPCHTNFPTLLYKYDIDGLSGAIKEEIYQRSRSKAQELVVKLMTPVPAPASYGGCGTLVPHWRLVREWESDSTCSLRLLFEEHAGGEYGQLALGTGFDVVPASFPLNPRGSEEFNNLRYYEKRTIAALFRNISLTGHPGVIRDGCGRIFVPSPGTMVPLHSLLDAPSFPSEIDSLAYVPRAINAVQMSCDNYYHWTVECLPRLIVSLEYLSNTSRLDEGWAIVLPMITTSFISETLEIMSLPKDTRIIQHDPETPLLVGELLSVDWAPARGANDRPGCEMTPARTALERVRRTFALPLLPLVNTRKDGHSQESRNTVVFISRSTDALSGKRSRIIVNEKEAINALSKICNNRNKWQAGQPEVKFEVFRGADYNQRETISLFRRARAVIGTHGAGLANIVYSAPATAVLEIALATPRHRDYMHLAMSLGHAYWLVDVVANCLETEIRLDIAKSASALMSALEAQQEMPSGSGALL